jgi:hypothetical protein
VTGVTGGGLVSSTILTAIVLVVMWVVVLVPMFARNRGDGVELRSVEEFSGAMRVLSRQTSGPAAFAADEDYADRSAREEMLLRRRRALGTLVMLTLVTLLLAIGWRPVCWIPQAGFDLLLAGYLWSLRKEVLRERSRRDRPAVPRPRVADVPHPAPLQRRPAAQRPVIRPAFTPAAHGHDAGQDSDALASRRAASG